METINNTQKMKAIINLNSNFGSLNGVIISNEQIRTIINQNLKNGTAKKLIDTEDTLMYELDSPDKKSNMHPIFVDALKPFGIL